MTLHLTPDILAAAYEYLRATPPFNEWNLPEADEIEFRVMKTRVYSGQHTPYVRSNRHCIDVSISGVGYTDTLIRVMAHEMVHAYQRIVNSETKNAGHNPEFHRLGRRVCKHHGFDPKEF